jgi:hypothetical protein
MLSGIPLERQLCLTSGGCGNGLLSPKTPSTVGFPFLDCVLKAEQQRLLELTNLLKRQRVFEVSKAILHLTLAVQRTYQ